MVYFIQKGKDARAVFEEINESETLHQSVIIAMDQRGKEKKARNNVLFVPGDRNISDLCNMLGKNVLSKSAADVTMTLYEHSLKVKECGFPTD